MDYESPSNTASLTALSGGALLDCTQAARYLNLSESYVRKAVAANGIPFVRIGTRTLFRRTDLDEWVVAHVVPTKAAVSARAEQITAKVMLGSRYSRRGAHL